MHRFEPRLAFALLLATSAIGPTGCVIEPGGSEGEIGSQAEPVVVCHSSPVVQGIDVSSWQGSIDWAKVKGSGRAWAYARVSDGTGYVDPYFAKNWPAMKAAGVLRGAYQFFEPAQSATAQANLVVAKIGKLGAGDLPAMIDVEATGSQSASTIASKIATWISVVQKGTGKTPIIYTGKYFWQDHLADTKEFDSYSLWLAAYVSGCPNTPGAWSDWKIWQYTSTGSIPGISGNVDHDVYAGTLGELQKLAGGPDTDGDGIADASDNCDTVKNPDQKDTDKDGQGDACDADDDGDGVLDTKDNCPLAKNADQKDTDKDGKGDVCDTDDDGDGVLDAKDDCPLVSNKNQADTDKDGMGDACDPDIDGDGIANAKDNCPVAKNADQKDTDGDGKGDACDTDDDGDGVPDATDDCKTVKNADQADTDGDKIGDACDPDLDGDGVPNATDNCAEDANADQKDTDKDGFGDACDADIDGDGFVNDADDCPDVSDEVQLDTDGDGLGDVCDDDRDGDGVPNATDNCPDVANPDQDGEPGAGNGDACKPGGDPNTPDHPGDPGADPSAATTAGGGCATGAGTSTDGGGAASWTFSVGALWATATFARRRRARR
jgi:GH25 family lysozyme M1 (1,4-beta-N-acetylmuramidase)